MLAEVWTRQVLAGRAMASPETGEEAADLVGFGYAEAGVQVQSLPGVVAGARSMIPARYRDLLRDPRTRRLLAGQGVSALGDGMGTV